MNSIDANILLSQLQELSSYTIERKNLGYKHVEDFIDFLSQNKWTITKEGESFEKRPIYSVQRGNGKQKILLWSQMHGNEASSSLGLMLALEYLTKTNNQVQQAIFENTQITAVVMLNPDGAEQKIRRNSMLIDLNRDALSLTAPESQILENLRKRLNPDFAFNLHDQDIYYAVNGKSTELAFLVPAADYSKTLYDNRKKAMSVLSYVIDSLSDKANMAKYNDSFMPTAFGDHFSAEGAATILIESGFNHKDKDRKKINILTATAILKALEAIALQKWETYSDKAYNNLKFNEKYYFFDIIIRNLPVKKNNQTYYVDLGISRDRRDPEIFNDYENNYLIWDIGDLRFKKAFVEKDLSGKYVEPKDYRTIQRFSPVNDLLRELNIDIPLW